MAISRINYVNQPYAGKRHTPDTSRLTALYSRLGEALADTALRKGEITQRGLQALGQLFTGYQQTKRDEKAATAAETRRQRERKEDKDFTAEQQRLERQERENREFAARAIRDKERDEDAATRKAEREEAAVSEAIDRAPRGIVDMSGNRALFQAAQKFPAQAARFVKQDGVDVLPMTGAERQVYEREKGARADREADNKRQDTAAAETRRHNLAMETASRQKQTANPEFYIRDGVPMPLQPNELKPGDVPYSAAAMQGKGGESADTRNIRTAAALNSIDVLKSLAPKRTPGPMGMVEGAIETVKGAAGYNTNVRQYNALLQPTAMQMAVAIQGAAGLSNAEREVFVNMLGNIATMDYESQMALLDKASSLVGSGADVQRVSVPDPTTGRVTEKWMPLRSRMPGSVTINPGASVPGATPPVKVLSITPVTKP